MKKFVRNAKGVLVFGACTISTILCFVPIMLMAILKLVLPIPFVRNLLSRAITAVGEFWIDGNSLIYSTTNSTRWDVRGLENLDPKKWYLIVGNHMSWVDIVALQTVLNRRIPFLKFFIKQELIWFPFLGLAWWAMDMPFMKRYSKSYLARHPEKKGKDLEATRKACEKFRATPTTVINFVEGTRFSEAKRIKRNSKFEHLLPPRAGGLALAIATMGDMFDVMLDVTVVYPGGPAPHFWAMCCGEFRHFVVDIKQRPVEDWMTDGDYSEDREYRRRFHQWLTTIWQEKDEKIASIRSEFEGPQ